MKLKLVRATWGTLPRTGGDKFESFPEFVTAAKKEGFDAVEVPICLALEFGRDNFMRVLDDNNMDLVFQIFSDGPEAPGSKWGHPDPSDDPKQHLAVFRASVQEALKFKPRLLFVNSHSGRDWFTLKESTEFFQGALKVQQELGATVYHETHRKRILYSPWVLRDLLATIPKEIEFVADLSHFLCVAEVPPTYEKLTQLVEAFAPRVRHVHCRVGYDHGPQVADPRVPRWMPYTEGMEKWWDTIWNAQKARNLEYTTITPEHGPPNYQQTNPETDQPLADIWAVNSWIAERRRKRFDELFSGDQGGEYTPTKKHNTQQ
jgi:sugar phosphate isomerase/epimerase